MMDIMDEMDFMDVMDRVLGGSLSIKSMVSISSMLPARFPHA